MWGFAAIGVAWACMAAAGGMVYVTLADGRRAERRLPIVIRMVLPFASNLTPFFDRSFFDSSRRRIQRKLVSAGLDEVMSASEFLAIKVLVGVVFGLVLTVVFWFTLHQVQGGAGKFLLSRQWFFYFFAFVLAFMFPSSWLQSTLAERHRSIQRVLPFVLDLLTLSVEAGMDFMSAISRIVERQVMNPLNEELIRVLREIQLGKTRKQALHDMAERIDHVDVRSVTGALIQADEMGISLGSILRIQSDQMRMRRFQRAEKLAHEAPVKMLAPLILFIFPAVLLVLLGPILLEMMVRWH